MNDLKLSLHFFFCNQIYVLGDEIFYGIFIPVMFFNVDSFIGRRFVFHWFVNMYIGQALKEFFKEERPKSPAIQMQSKWSNEYSLPSTHAMGSLSIAASILYFSTNRWLQRLVWVNSCITINDDWLVIGTTSIFGLELPALCCGLEWYLSAESTSECIQYSTSWWESSFRLFCLQFFCRSPILLRTFLLWTLSHH